MQIEIYEKIKQLNKRVIEFLKDNVKDRKELWKKISALEFLTENKDAKNCPGCGYYFGESNSDEKRNHMFLCPEEVQTETINEEKSR